MLNALALITTLTTSPLPAFCESPEIMEHVAKKATGCKAQVLARNGKATACLARCAGNQELGYLLVEEPNGTALSWLDNYVVTLYKAKHKQ